MKNISPEVPSGMTVGQLVEYLQTQNPLLPVTIFAGGDVWLPHQIVHLDADAFDDETIEIGCGWIPADDSTE